MKSTIYRQINYVERVLIKYLLSCLIYELQFHRELFAERLMTSGYHDPEHVRFPCYL